MDAVTQHPEKRELGKAKAVGSNTADTAGRQRAREEGLPWLG